MGRKKKNIVQKVALYSRISRDDGFEGESNSIINQKLLLEDAAKRYGFTEYEHYIDDGVSGTKENRPALMRLEDDITNGLVNVVIVKDTSRLARNAYLGSKYTDFLFAYYDVRLIAVNENIDTAKGEDLMMPFRHVMNDLYAKDISVKRKSTNRIKGEQGIPLSPPPYGYIQNPNDKKSWLVDEEAAVVVRRIFDMAMAGFGTLEIALALDKDGILTPLHYWKNKGLPRGGNANHKSMSAWGASTVISILDKQEYCGDIINFKTFSRNHKDSRRVENSPENMRIFLNANEAIVDRETFEKVNAKRALFQRKKPLANDINLFAGLLVCSDCGANLHYHFNQHNPTIKYYNCPNNNNARKTCDDTHYVRRDYLEEVVLAELRDFMKFATKHEEEFAKYLAVCEDKKTDITIKLLEKEIDDMAYRYEKIDRLYEALYEKNVEGIIDNDRFAKLSNKYSTEQSDLSERLKLKRAELQKINERELTYKNFLATIRKYTRMKKLTPKILNDLIEKIVIYQAEKIDGLYVQRIHIYYHFVGKLSEDDKNIAVAEPIIIHTRKGVRLTNKAPDKKAN